MLKHNAKTLIYGTLSIDILYIVSKDIELCKQYNHRVYSESLSGFVEALNDLNKLEKQGIRGFIKSYILRPNGTILRSTIVYKSPARGK